MRSPRGSEDESEREKEKSRGLELTYLKIQSSGLFLPFTFQDTFLGDSHPFLQLQPFCQWHPGDSKSAVFLSPILESSCWYIFNLDILLFKLYQICIKFSMFATSALHSIVSSTLIFMVRLVSKSSKFKPHNQRSSSPSFSLCIPLVSFC